MFDFSAEERTFNSLNGFFGPGTSVYTFTDPFTDLFPDTFASEGHRKIVKWDWDAYADAYMMHMLIHLDAYADAYPHAPYTKPTRVLKGFGIIRENSSGLAMYHALLRHLLRPTYPLYIPHYLSIISAPSILLPPVILTKTWANQRTKQRIRQRVGQRVGQRVKQRIKQAWSINKNFISEILYGK
ncbi:hypothetical protein P167DRAFT_550434 [Morchella conica CCBAS932]|uniref:Uncharacterized protein n=1 Tax=Morchella conica CCBAS932 TaxID=1392247 RepID=A0A3N4KAV4_9PEZI|nr:hypothetical protein P167DRAFT_550434 [Morchella conica CCBAS932]